MAAVGVATTTQQPYVLVIILDALPMNGIAMISDLKASVDRGHVNSKTYLSHNTECCPNSLVKHGVFQLW
jgi:hypothetical protein